METSEETVNREPRRLDEVLDRDELRTLVHGREAREAADSLVNLLQLARGELLTTPQPDRIATDDVLAGDHPCQCLGPAPFVRVDRRFGGDRILLERTDANAETPVVLDREADERTRPNAVRRRPVLREGYAEARISQLLDLPGFQFHDPCKYGTPPNTYAVRPMPATPDGKPLVAGNRPRPQLPSVSERSDRILPKPHESRRNRTDAMDRQVDVLVVGAGPTGSTAAKYAALGGTDVLLIEKRSEIGTPVRCGEGVAKRWLEEIGLAPSREIICHEVDGARIIAPDGTALVLDETRAGNECGYILERDLFDRFLAREAAKAGAEIMIKTSAVALLREDGRVLGARCEPREASRTRGREEIPRPVDRADPGPGLRRNRRRGRRRGERVDAPGTNARSGCHAGGRRGPPHRPSHGRRHPERVSVGAVCRRGRGGCHREGSDRRSPPSLRCKVACSDGGGTRPALPDQGAPHPGR